MIQTFFSEDTSEEIQIHSDPGTQSSQLGLDPATLQNMRADHCYNLLDSARKKNQSDRNKKMQEALQGANDLDDRSHEYFDVLLQGNCQFAQQKLSDLYKKLGNCPASGYHVVCCYDESGSMRGRPWHDL